MLTFLVVPIVGMLSQFVGLRPTLTGVAAVALFMGGILRVVYALMFEEAIVQPNVQAAPMAPGLGTTSPEHGALPPQTTYPVDRYREPATGSWRDTNDLQPGSIVEGTTKLLEKEERPRQ